MPTVRRTPDGSPTGVGRVSGERCTHVRRTLEMVFCIVVYHVCQQVYLVAHYILSSFAIPFLQYCYPDSEVSLYTFTVYSQSGNRAKWNRVTFHPSFRTCSQPPPEVLPATSYKWRCRLLWVESCCRLFFRSPLIYEFRFIAYVEING